MNQSASLLVTTVMSVWGNRLITTILWILGINLLTAAPVHADAIQDYQRDLDAYRSLYGDYQIKKSEFSQFGTFTAEEDLVAVAQEMLLARADVWITYWNMLAMQLQGEPTIGAETRTLLFNFYATETTWLAEHKGRLTQLKRRDELAKEAAALNAKSEDYEIKSSMSTALIYVGRLQRVTRNLLQLNEELSKRVAAQTFPETIKSTKLRGFQVNHDRLTAVLERINAMEQEYASGRILDSESTDRIKQKLEPLFTEVTQLRTVQAELAEEVLW